MLKARCNENSTVWSWLAVLSVTGFLLAPLPAVSSDRNSVDAPGFNVDPRWPSPPKLAHDGAGQLMPTRPLRFIMKASVDSSGVHVNANSYGSSISADGRSVAFVSGATNLVPGDTNRQTDVFVHDRLTGTITRVSVDSAGQQADYSSESSSISADQGFVAFKSWAANLVLNDRNRSSDIFAHDRVTGTTTCASVGLNGYHATDGTHSPSMSAQGLIIAFNSPANNLVPESPEYIQDVFIQGSCGHFDAVAESGRAPRSHLSMCDGWHPSTHR